jgi:hypothetical protein
MERATNIGEPSCNPNNEVFPLLEEAIFLLSKVPS